MSRRRFRVAVVDDDGSVRRALQRMLNASGLDAEIFASGEEFLVSLRFRRPDCVVLDMHMPGMSGLDVQQQMTRAEIDLPIIVVTGHHEAGLCARCLTAGASSYLCKPLDSRMLLDAISLAIGSAAGS
jgi:FixJ family two-component response regulator